MIYKLHNIYNGMYQLEIWKDERIIQRSYINEIQADVIIKTIEQTMRENK